MHQVSYGELLDIVQVQLGDQCFTLLRARWFPDGRLLDDTCFVALVETHRPWNLRRGQVDRPMIEACSIDNMVVVVPLPNERANQTESFSVVLDRCFDYQEEMD